MLTILPVFSVCLLRLWLTNWSYQFKLALEKGQIIAVTDKTTLTLLFPMSPFDPLENIRKPNISYPLICTRTSAYQGVRNVRFSDVSMGIKREHWEEKG